VAFGGGTNYNYATTSTFSMTPSTVGDLILVEVISETVADYATALSSTNVTWSVLVAHTALPATSSLYVSTIFIGQVTSTSTATVTVTFNTGSPTIRLFWTEFSTTAGYANVILDVSGTVSTSTLDFPSLTPGHGSGELYFGYAFNSSSATAGSTSGYTYQVDGNGNGACWNASCANSAQQPVWAGTASDIYGIAVLLRETNSPVTINLPVIQVAESAYPLGLQGINQHVSLPVIPVSEAAYPVTGSSTGFRQVISGHTTGTSLTLTLPENTVVGNGLIVAMCGFFGGGVTSIALGGTIDTYAQVSASSANNAQVWSNTNIARAATSVVIITTTAGILAWVYEVSGSIFYDTSSSDSGTSTSWTSTATGTTIPYYTHFIVGIGTIVSNTGSITATASGWTNETSYTDIVGAGSHAIGGVSGYRQAVGATTYTYSGTSGTSSAWAGAAATFVVVPVAGVYITGYQFLEHTSYTGISATFTIPSSMPVNTSSDCSVWIGVADIYQVGIFMSASSGYTGNVNTSCWSWWFGGGGGAGELWSTTAFPTGAGNSISLTLDCDGTFWYAIITNHTQGWSYTEVKSVLGTNVGCVSYNATTGVPSTWGWIYPVGNAIVGIEQELPYQLPDYDTIPFTSISTTPAISNNPIPVFSVITSTDGFNQYPGPFNKSAGSFTMYWNKAN